MANLNDQLDHWTPSGIILEDTALGVARSMRNSLVVAGPGAGKTELLAQRACCLLESDTCSDPYKILAISFKREAAENLKKRVNLRCGDELSSRFDSMTFDAFAKDILDRFKYSLPLGYIPSNDYTILTGKEASPSGIRQKMIDLPDSELPCSFQKYRINEHTLYDCFVGHKLNFQLDSTNETRIASYALWKYLLNKSPSELTFPMISRLAEYIVLNNNFVKKAIQSTYRFVFLDEFQDATLRQFDLAASCFGHSKSILTAVGDNKQRIMGGAGAMQNGFLAYRELFNANQFVLRNNYRSCANLVQIQAVLARELDASSEAAIPCGVNTEEGVCHLYEYPNHIVEANHLSRIIRNLIDNGTKPEEIVVLCRANISQISESIIQSLSVAGIKVYLENGRRDILAEPVTQFVLSMLDLSTGISRPELWYEVSCTIRRLFGDQDDERIAARMDSFYSYLELLASKRPAAESPKEIISLYLKSCLDFVGCDRFSAGFSQYSQVEYLNEIIDKLADCFLEELKTCDWDHVCDAVRGIGAVSIMTMHKSKGLEFHTVVYLGLEDQTVWNYRGNETEENCGFFVALSRAKNQCIFTYCRTRADRRNPNRSRVNLRRVYDVFEEAGVTVEQIQRED